MVVCELIHSCIEHLDDEHCNAILNLSLLKEAKEELDDLSVMKHLYLSSFQKPTTFNAMKQERLSDWAFSLLH
jgi:hypothetical protein